MRSAVSALASLVLASYLPALADPQLFTLDLGHAYIGWEIDHFGYSNTVGQFRTFDGKFLIDEDTPENSEIEFTIQAASIDSNHVGRDNHLRAPDFLNVEQFPTIDFKSTEIAMQGDDAGIVTGDLTFMGITKPFSMHFKVTDDAQFAAFLPRYNERRAVGFEATGTFDRFAHGFGVLDFPGSPIGQNIDLNIHFDLVDCVGAPDDNIPCTYGRRTDVEYPNE